MKKSKNIIVGVIGNILEYYNLTLYGFLTFQLTPLFFPKTESIDLEKLVSLGTFTLPFLARPFGALVLGAFGDTFGRRKALSLSILVASLPSFIIALLPGYGVVGLWAPVFLITARILQGISMGGEYGNVVNFILENTPANQQNFMGSLLCASGFVGGLLAALLATLFTLGCLPPHSWRVPFFMGGCFALFGYFLRRTIESPPQPPLTQRNLLNPIREIFASEKLSLFRAMGIGITSSGPFYIASIYLNGLYTYELGLGTAPLMFINLCYLGGWAVLLPVFGKLADHITGQRLMKISTLLIGCVGVGSYYSLHHPSLLSLLLFQGMVTCASVGFLASMNVYLRNLFSKTSRSSGISLGYTLGGVFMGGSSPLIIEFLRKLNHAPVGPYLILVSFIGVATIFHKGKESCQYN